MAGLPTKKAEYLKRSFSLFFTSAKYVKPREQAETTKPDRSEYIIDR